MSARRLLLALLFLGVGFALGSLFGGTGTGSSARGDLGVAPAPQGDAVARLDRIEAALARLLESQALAAPFRSEPVAEPVASAPPVSERIAVETGAAGVESVQAPVAEELAALRTAVEDLRRALAERGMSARFPTLEMIRGAPEANMAELEALQARAQGGSDEHAAMRESVRWMSQDEVLARFGRPHRIGDNGAWTYRMQRQDAGQNRKMVFTFVENYVSDVVCYGLP